MKDVAPHDRPREKLERVGVGALGDNELLALILGSGVRMGDVLEMANTILVHAGGLQRLTRLAPADLRRIPGVGRARAGQVLAAIELGRRTLTRGAAERPRLNTPATIAGYLLPQFGARPVEHFGVVMLDTKHRVLCTKIVAVGSLDTTVVHPREVFREAVATAAAAIVLFHNHPSGDPTPSPDDLSLTARLVDAGTVVGIDVVDHVILADNRYFSMLESGRIVASAVRWCG